MKKLLLALYIILVVTASLASRAEAAPMIELRNAQFEYDADANRLSYTVQFPNRCTSQARVVLAPSEFENVFYIQVVAAKLADFCQHLPANEVNALVQTHTVDARVLKFELQRLNADLNGAYMLVSRDGKFQQIIDFAAIDHGAPVPSANLSGALLAPNAYYTGEPNDFVDTLVFAN